MITPEEFKQKMQEYDGMYDMEERHAYADALMCVTLQELGYEDGIKIFESMSKWYA